MTTSAATCRFTILVEVDLIGQDGAVCLRGSFDTHHVAIGQVVALAAAVVAGIATRCDGVSTCTEPD